MFLGFKSSTVSFTSEEVDRLRAARDESRSRVGRREESRTRAHQQQQLFQKQQAGPHQEAAAGAARKEPLNREESFACRLKRTESRGRKRTENPNSGGSGDGGGTGGGEEGGQENADPNCSVKKRQQLGGIVQQRSQQLLGRSACGSYQPPARISGKAHQPLC